MEYRKIGDTGMAASVVGLGTEHLDFKPYALVEETVHAAVERGINILDLFMPGDEVRTNVGRALAGRREKVLIQGHIGSVDSNGQYDVSRDVEVCKRYFESLLRCLGTDYIDFGMLLFMDSQEAFDEVFGGGVIEYARHLKRSGTIRAIGASSHNPEIALKVVETGLVDLLMFSVNPAFDLMPAGTGVLDALGDPAEPEKAPLFSSLMRENVDPKRAELYRRCESLGVAITVMKTLGAGKLLSPDHTPFARPLTVGQCVHYALTRPAVVSALVGCKGEAEVREAVRYLEMSDAERDYAEAIGSFRGSFRGSCVYCNHCQPCPSGIDIGAVGKYLDIAALDADNVPPGVAAHYRALAAHASDCVACGECERRCPFSVAVIDNMRRAASVFGF